MNGQTETSPSDALGGESGLRAYEAGDATVVALAGCGVQVSFSGEGPDAEAAVVVSDTWVDVTTLAGLCGNCDGVADQIDAEAFQEEEEEGEEKELVI
jgi:hypothetical protein